MRLVEAPASMEGWAIARPNEFIYPSASPIRSGFNGGPGNCPAELDTPRALPLRV